MKTEKISVQKICMIAFAICINFVGGQIALFLKLPIYLDSIGTVFVAAVLGPFYGMLPNLLSGLLMGMTVDIYSLYYAPVGILLGFVTGLVYRKFQPKKWQIFPAALVAGKTKKRFKALCVKNIRLKQHTRWLIPVQQSLRQQHLYYYSVAAMSVHRRE